MKYKVGDKVRVRKDLVGGEYYGEVLARDNMSRICGETVTIDTVYDGFYRIVEYGYCWTDEMFEPVEEELTAEEAIRLRAKMCKNAICSECKFGKRNNGEWIECCDFSQKYPERVIEILKQFKKEHEKKEVETEFACIVRVIEDLGDSKRCVYEEDLAGVKGETFRMAMERVLKEYCKEHEGKFFAVYEEICRVKE